MWFLVPRSKPLEWVIVKVQASNQDSPTESQFSGFTLLFPASSKQLWLSTVFYRFSHRQYFLHHLKEHPGRPAFLATFVQIRGFWLNMRQNARAQWYSSKNVRKWWLESCTEFSSAVFSHCILDLIHKTFRFTHQWSPTGNVFTVSHIMKPLRWRLHSRPENKYHRETFGWFSQMNFLFFLFFLSFFFFLFFFGKLCGWCWCQCVDTQFSQWLSAAFWIDAIVRPEVTTLTTMLSTNISFGNFMS